MTTRGSGRQYAAKTTVPIATTQGRIRDELLAMGVREFAPYENLDQQVAGIAFTYEGRKYRLLIPLPVPKVLPTYKVGAVGQRIRLTPKQARDDIEQDHRARWRALLDILQAIRNAQELKAFSLSRFLLSFTLLPGGGDFGEWADEELPRVLSLGLEMPSLLPGAQTQQRQITDGGRGTNGVTVREIRE